MREADAAIPDNPSGPYQLGTSDQANLSGVACGFVTLDTTAPVESPHADRTAVTVGQLVTFSAQSTDTSSGVDAGGYTWTFGDNTAGATGASATHTYTQPGTFQVTLTGKDDVGNAGTGHLTITVTAAGGNSDTGSTGGQPGSGGQTGTRGQTGAGGQTGTGGSRGTTSTQVSQQSGGGGTQSVALGKLTVIAPRRFAIAKRTLLVALSTKVRGTVTVSLTKGTKTVATRRLAISPGKASPCRLTLPKSLKPGTYTLKISFLPKGAHKPTVKTVRVIVHR